MGATGKSGAGSGKPGTAGRLQVLGRSHGQLREKAGMARKGIQEVREVVRESQGEKEEAEGSKEQLAGKSGRWVAELGDGRNAER